MNGSNKNNANNINNTNVHGVGREQPNAVYKVNWGLIQISSRFFKISSSFRKIQQVYHFTIFDP